ncbi:hypothetical protein KY359_04780 [Candidatus Woesearchaeota archaeon]|nr:hypothetical protein [Candidatus Woesearchaeota archaeon]
MKGLSNLFSTTCRGCISIRQEVGELTDMLGGEARDLLDRVTAELKERLANSELKERLTTAEQMIMGYMETGNAAEVLKRYSDTSGENILFTTAPSIIRAAVARYTAQMADRPDFNRGMDIYHMLHPWDNSFVARVCDSLDPRNTYWVGPTTTSTEVARG